jgi:hypothetical protein
MSGDMGGGQASPKRPRVLGRAQVGWPRALQQLKDLLYEAYLAAGAPSLDEITADIAADDALAGAPARDTIRRCISAASSPGNQADAVSIATVLARRAAWEEQDLARRVRDLWVQARMAQGVGRPIGHFSDDASLVLADLEVHPALDAGGARDRFGILPAYVRREHDTRLDAMVARALAGRSGLAVLVGGSSTGKTRALWEAVRQLPDPWRLWHPLSPTRPDAVVADLDDIAPHTVVWLNEAQHYLGSDPLGEQVAAGLRSLLYDSSRAPVLVLATLWPAHWHALTTRTDPDRHAHARELLREHNIDVPDAFTDDDLATLKRTTGADPRLIEAAERADDAQVVQYLAGVPVLTARYDTARGATLALINAAMDARRLGAGPHIPLAWLADAAPGYLTGTEWNSLDDDWLTQALDYVTQECNGIPGILTPVKISTRRNQRTGNPPVASGAAFKQPARNTQGPHYLLADYLDQYGRRHRADAIPPVDFWTAASHHAHPADLQLLGHAAWNRGLRRDAAQLHKRAATDGNANAHRTLFRYLRLLHPADTGPARWAAAHAALDEAPAVVWLLDSLREAGAHEQAAILAARAAEQVTLDDAYAVARLLDGLRLAGTRDHIDTLLARDPATHTALDDPYAVARLLDGLRLAGAQDHIDTLLARDPATHTALDNAQEVTRLLGGLRRAGAHKQADLLTSRAATHMPLDNPNAVARLLDSLRQGPREPMDALLARDPAGHAVLESVSAVAGLLDSFRSAGAHKQVDALATRAASHIPPNDFGTMGTLLASLQRACAYEQIALMATRATTHTPLDSPARVAGLLGFLQRAGARQQVDALLARDPASHAALDDPYAVAELLDSLLSAAAHDQVEVLATRAASHAPLDNPAKVATLLSSLRRAEAHQQATTLVARSTAQIPPDTMHTIVGLQDLLRQAGTRAFVVLARDPAAPVALNEPFAVAVALDFLLQTGAQQQMDALLARHPADHASLDDPYAVAKLLDSLRSAGAHGQAAVLATRAAAGAPLVNPHGVAGLLESLQEAHMPEQVAVLAARLPAAGYFDKFLTVGDNLQRFHFGREPDGSPSLSWAWDDLE